MKFYVGLTDDNWFKALAYLKPEEVNFWQPGGSHAFKAIEPGAPFLFKLHSPRNYIVGGGFFVRHALLPLSLAWEAFEQKNGAPDLVTLRTMISTYRSIREADPTIGCIILTKPFFLQEIDWIPVPKDWKPNIVQGKTYDTDDQIGRELWQTVSKLIEKENILTAMMVIEETARYGPGYVVRNRLGQGAFKVLVTDAYNRRCAVTGEKTLPVLQAAHIKPYSESGPHKIDNGLLLRADLHILFDKGYLTVTPDLRTEVSKRIESNFHNGKEYYKFHGKKLEVIPSQQMDHPSAEYLRWHNEYRFVA
jgi:putative restriction endonuclease